MPKHERMLTSPLSPYASSKLAGEALCEVFTVKPGENDPAKAITPAAPAVDPKAFLWRYDMMKAADGKVYVPYTLTVPAEALPGSNDRRELGAHFNAFVYKPAT